MKTSIEIEKSRAENAEKYIQHLIHQGSKIPPKVEKLSPPFWYDEKKFRRGQRFIRENYFVVSSSTLCASIVFLVELKFDKLFPMTGKYDTFAKSIRRHFTTLRKLQSWYYGNIYEKNSTLYKTLYAAGRIHKTNSLKLVDTQMGITQKDLVLGIFAYTRTSIVVTEYEYFYTQSTRQFDEKKFEGFIHYWRVIGYHIGQMDEFNLFNGDVYEVKKKFEIVFKVFFKPTLEEPPRVDGILFADIIKMASNRLYIIDKDGLIEFIRRKYKLPPKPLRNKKSKIFVSAMIFIHEKILKTKWICPIFRPILNYLSKIIEDYVTSTYLYELSDNE